MARRMKRHDAKGWLRGEGPYSYSKEFKPDRPEMYGVTPTPAGRMMGGRDISKTVDKGQAVNGGFSGGIPNPGYGSPIVPWATPNKRRGR